MSSTNDDAMAAALRRISDELLALARKTAPAGTARTGAAMTTGAGLAATTSGSTGAPPPSLPAGGAGAYKGKYAFYFNNLVLGGVPYRRTL
jgi:hypothetical protein